MTFFRQIAKAFIRYYTRETLVNKEDNFASLALLLYYANQDNTLPTFAKMVDFLRRRMKIGTQLLCRTSAFKHATPASIP